MFGRKPAPGRVRKNHVLRLINLGMAETDAADRDIDGPDFARAKARFDEAVNEATQAEMSAAFDALRRNGY
ncbi:hypothetical protein [Micromonospora sp. NPDC023814]|uniref:hypothetical protein n=1 Tax=Micromonospora sp. NPDC023814 TaxID=3154596 RepID=UPI0033E925FC